MMKTVQQYTNTEQDDDDLSEVMTANPLHLDIAGLRDDDDAHSHLSDMRMLHTLITPNTAKQTKQCTFPKPKQVDFVYNVNPKNNAVYISRNQYYDSDTAAIENTLFPSFECIDYGKDNKVKINNVCDYKEMHNQFKAVTVAQNEKFKRIKDQF